MSSTFLSKAAFAAGILALVSACATTSGGYSAGDAPEWADQPPKGCGVGTLKYRGNRGMARDGAISRARNDLAKQIEITNKSLFKDYQESGETGGKDFTEELQTQATKQVTNQTLAGTRVVKVKLMDKDMFALVCLDPETFASAFQRMNTLSEVQREALRKRAKKAFSELDAEVEKIEGQK